MVTIIAEISGNHEGKLENALEMVDAAKAAGADWVKFQAMRADKITMPMNFNADGLWKGRNLYELYKEAETPLEWWGALLSKGRVFASVFDLESVEILEDLGCPMYKISSFEAQYHRLIYRVISTGKPVIISTGTLTQVEFEQLKTFFPYTEFMICSSNYPAKISDYPIKQLKGNSLSDHTLGNELACIAASKGCKYIEKHFKGNFNGVDAEFSLNNEQFKQYVKMIRQVQSAPCQLMPANTQYRPSIFFNRDLPEGHKLTEQDLKICRPNLGISPNELRSILEQSLKRNVIKGFPCNYNDLTTGAQNG